MTLWLKTEGGLVPVAGSDSLAVEDWTGVTFENGWSNVGYPTQDAQYRKAGDMVQVRGALRGGASGTVAFTLPAGYAPPANLDFSSSLYSFGSTPPHQHGSIFVTLFGSIEIAWYTTVEPGVVGLNFSFSVTP